MNEEERIQADIAEIQVKIDFQQNAKDTADNKLQAHLEDKAVLEATLAEVQALP